MIAILSGIINDLRRYIKNFEERNGICQYCHIRNVIVTPQDEWYICIKCYYQRKFGDMIKP